MLLPLSQAFHPATGAGDDLLEVLNLLFLVVASLFVEASFIVAPFIAASFILLVVTASFMLLLFKKQTFNPTAGAGEDLLLPLE